MREESFMLLWPPTANNSKRWTGKKFVSTTQLVSFHEHAKWALRAERIKTMSPPYEVTIWFHAPKNVHRYDIANYEKAVCDAMVKAQVITDDCKIDMMHLYRGNKSDKGFVMVRVKEVPERACNPVGSVI